jgi:hypothetical protein
MKKNVFKMPTPVTIMGRSASITNSFVNGIIPAHKPTNAEIQEALNVLHQNEDDVRCVYCGDKKTEWDHLYPLIINKKPTGYITEIANLVPACGKCNQSKGNSNWKEWMLGNAEQSPKTRNISDIHKRIKIIENYERHFKKQKINLEEIVGKDLWKKYMDAYNILISNMNSAQAIMDEIREKLSDKQTIKTKNTATKSCQNKKSNSPKKLVIPQTTKNNAIKLLKKEGFNISGNVTFSSENNSSGKRYWSNPNISFLNKDWWLILNDTSNKKIHLFFIPANAISKKELCLRSDDTNRIDLQILHNDSNFEDSRSKYLFKKWHKKTLNL